MWFLVAQFVLGIFLREDSDLIFFKVIKGLNIPMLTITTWISPHFINNKMAPIYAALVVFVARYYFFPLVIGFEVDNFFQMPLEKLLLSAKADLGL